jgi:hypothetical protein
MNEEQRAITELKKCYAELDERIAALEQAISRSDLIPGRMERRFPEISNGMHEFWFGGKKNSRHSP